MKKEVEKLQEQKEIIRVWTVNNLILFVRGAQPGARFRFKSRENKEFIKENLEMNTGKKIRVQLVPDLELTDKSSFDIEVLE